MVVGFRGGIDNTAHFTAGGAVDFGATLFLTSGLDNTLRGTMTGGVYNVVLVREAVILIALMHRVAVFGTSRRNNGNGEGILGGQDLFGLGRITVLAMQSLFTVLFISRRSSDDALIPDVTCTAVVVGHGMGSIALAVHQHGALLGAGSLFQAFGVLGVPIMVTDSGHRHQHSFVAPLVAAVHPTLAFSFAIRSLDDFAKARVIVGMHLGDVFGLCCLAYLAGEGLDAALSSGRLLRYNAFLPLMLAGGRKVTHMLLIVAALTDIVYAARSATGSGSSDFLILMAQCRDRRILIGLCGILIAGMQRVTVLCAGRSDHSIREGIAQSGNYFFMYMGLVLLAGVGALAIFFVSCFLGNNTIVPSMSRRRNNFRIGMGCIVQAGESLDAVLSAGRSLGDSAIIPLVPQSRDFFGLGLCAAGILALEGLYTGSLTSSGLSDSAVIPLMTQRGNLLGLCLGAAITGAGIGLNTSVRAASQAWPSAFV